MKKILIATTALVATAGVAAADVTLSGYGRFGMDHNSGATSPATQTRINSRFRLNFDATTETDAGVTFGARVRLQQSSGSSFNGIAASSTLGTVSATNGASLNAAQFSATYQGFRMEVGNANTAIDSVALMYNSEIGYLDRGFGDPIGGFQAYSSTPYSADLTGEDGASGRMGVFASYKLGAGTVRASYINPNQNVIASGRVLKAETSISADYNFGQFTVAGAYADNAAFADNASSLFLGAEYAVMPNANVGLLYFQDDSGVAGVANQDRVTIYGNYKMDAMTFKGYIADDNKVGNLTDTAFGVGMDYDLGGARLAADIHRNYNKDTIVGLGVRFNF
ncbi:porin [Pseudorhodobacter ferrugineus]|uniref:porin n=1 Tax=Pseudorhodobacter ferrugineus TaxID=77008 RepID=UPI00067BB95E|nr:porin [Pseudorhodobacter ferrugineus]